MSLLARLFPCRSDERAKLRPLWHRVVALAREPQWYEAGGIADTLAGRFDTITLVLCCVLLRMERDRAMVPASVRLTELFVEDMDGQLRESGVGDLVVGKHMGKLMGVLGGRLGAYRAGLAAMDGDAALAAAVARNATLLEGRDPVIVAAQMRRLAAQLDGLPQEPLLAGDIPR